MLAAPPYYAVCASRLPLSRHCAIRSNNSKERIFHPTITAATSSDIFEDDGAKSYRLIFFFLCPEKVFLK